MSADKQTQGVYNDKWLWQQVMAASSASKRKGCVGQCEQLQKLGYVQQQMVGGYATMVDDDNIAANFKEVGDVPQWQKAIAGIGST